MIYLFENMTYNHSLGTVIKDGEEFKLTKIQKNLLKYLLDNPQEVLSKQVLMDQVWQRTVTENSIDQRIADLRSIVEQDRKNPKIISTNFGQGIFLNCAVVIENKTKQLNPPPTHQSIHPVKILLSLLLLSAVVLIFFVYWTQYRVEPTNQRITDQLSKQNYMTQFSADKRQSITEMFASLPKPTRKKFRRYLSNVSDDKKQTVTLQLLAMTTSERIQYIRSL